MNADTLRRLAAVDMPAEALREVLTIFAEIEAKNEERRARDAARKKEERDAKKAASKDNPRTIQGQSKECPADVPHAPAPARGLELTSLDSKNLSKESPPKGGPKKGSRQARTQLAPDAQPDDRDRAAAQRAGMSDGTFRNEWEKFRSRHVAKGEAMLNWNAAWVQWIANWTSYGSKQVEQANARAGPRNSGDPFGNAIREIQENEHVRRFGQPSSEYGEPTGAEPRDITPRGGLFEPTRDESRGDYLDLGPVLAYSRG